MSELSRRTIAEGSTVQAGLEDVSVSRELELVCAAAGFRAVLAAAGCVGLPSLSDFLE